MYMYKIQSVKLLTVVVDENQLHKIVQSQKINGEIQTKRKSVLLYFYVCDGDVKVTFCLHNLAWILIMMQDTLLIVYRTHVHVYTF